MVGFILTGHGQFSTGLASSVEMVAGEQPNFRTVTFENAEAATYGETLATAIREMRAASDSVVVFVDLLGGTPFNQAMLASTQVEGVEVVTGTNLPMLIECLFMRNSNEAMTAGEVVELALRVGPAGIVHKRLEVKGDDEDEM